MSKHTVAVPLVEGFEEIEALTIIDVLRRADFTVLVAGDKPGPVRGAHGVDVTADTALAEVKAGTLSAIVLPGGMPGAKNLAENPRVQSLIKEVAAAGRITAAICAAPWALAAAGVHAGHQVTCYPGFQDKLKGGTFVEDRVVVDRTVVTSRGPGTALEFALTLVGLLAGRDLEQELARGMLAVRPAPAHEVRA
jgi:4-methyl-5(b-hydroxyethyl)-thiazole monophosphate biosynthesis